MSTPDFTYHDDDQEGLKTLEAVGRAVHFNRWMYDQVGPFLSGNILEIGSGIGNISAFFLEQNALLTLSDIRDHYCEALQQRFQQSATLSGVLNINLVHADFKSIYKSLEASFDGAFALNVIEHIEEDSLAMKNLHWLLKPGGTVVILVPAGQVLYNKLDVHLEHFKRYDKPSLRRLLQSSGFKVNKLKYFNALGIPAWWVSGAVMKNRIIKEGQMDIYEKLVPLAKLIDLLCGNLIGLSVIGYAVKE
jgi:SAM-dependent methyltransferase